MLLAYVLELLFPQYQLKPSQYVSIPENVFSEIKMPRIDALFSNIAILKNAVIICFVATLETLLSMEAIDKLDPYNRISPKNRELVVRTPESLDPYSSHIYLFASFFAGFDIEGNETVHIPFLNYYKTMVWNIYEELKKQNPNIRFISDQSDKYILSSEEDSDSKLKHLISVSSWQQHTNLKSYLEGHHPSVIIVSSLNNAEVVEQLLRDAEDDTTFLFIPLTASLQKQRVTDIVEILFIKKDSDNLSKYKPQWVLSPLRTKINENEKKIKKLLNIED